MLNWEMFVWERNWRYPSHMNFWTGPPPHETNVEHGGGNVKQESMKFENISSWRRERRWGHLSEMNFWPLVLVSPSRLGLVPGDLEEQ